MDGFRRWIDKIVKSTAVWYTASSLLAFGIDYLITLELNNLLETSMGMTRLQNGDIALAIGWLVSSHVNFFVNRTLVFRSDTPVIPAYLKYYSLSLPIFLFKTFVLANLLLHFTVLPMWIVSPLAQTAMFVLTYFVQKRLIFLKKNKDSDPKDGSDDHGEPS